jgi:hypothetical protein
MNLFRVPARWLLLTSLSLALLAGEGLAFLRQLGATSWPAAGPWQRLATATRLLAGVILACLLAAILWPLQRAGTDPVPTPLVVLWLALATGAVALAFAALAAAPRSWPAGLFALLVLGELFAASRSLEYNNPNPESVYTESRPVIDALRQGQDAGRRLLSTAATGYHPADADQLVGPYRDRLGPGGVMATLVNTKYKEIVSPNLSMVFGIPTIDGYDGGVLPLRRYVTFKRVAVPPEQNLPDSLLRDQLRQLPPGPALRLLGPSHLLLDSMGDVTRDGVFYDLATSVAVSPGEPVRFTHVASLPGAPPDGAGVGPLAGLGLVTALENASGVPDGALVATVTLGDGAGQRWRADLVAGRDTAEGTYGAARHRQPPPLAPQRSGPSLYLSRFTMEDVPAATWVAVQSHLPPAMGRLRVHGLSLIGRDGQSWPVSVDGDTLRLVHRSDVKLYQVQDALPRAYVVEEARLVDGPDAAVQALVAPDHQPERVAVLERDPGAPLPAATAPSLRLRLRGLVDGLKTALGLSHDERLGTVPGDLPLPVRSPATPSSGSPAPRVTWSEDAPERVVLTVESSRPGFLVLRDTYYPGWSATVDGRPVPLLRADVLFRAVPIEAGAHTVEMRYRSLPFERGALIAAVALGLTALLAILPTPRWWRRPPQEPPSW